VCAEMDVDRRVEELRRLLRGFRDPVTGKITPLRITDGLADKVLREEGFDSVR